LNDNLVGPTILGFSTSEDDMGAAARLFEEFAKTNKAFELKAAAFDGKVYQGAEVSVIANLPNQEKRLLCLPMFFKLLFRNWVALLQRSKRKTSQKLHKLKFIYTPFNIHLELFSWL
jgi:large subunit ribosomal protein L10